MQPEQSVVIIAHVGHGKLQSIARAIEAVTQTNVEVVSPFAPEPLEFKISSINVLQDLVQEPYYEPKPSKFIDKPRHNYRKR